MSKDWKDEYFSKFYNAAAAGVALVKLVEWAEAYDARKEKDRQLGVAIMLHERVTVDDSRELARLKSEELGKLLALREAAEPLLAAATARPAGAGE